MQSISKTVWFLNFNIYEYHSFQHYYKVNRENIQCIEHKFGKIFSQNKRNLFEFLKVSYAENNKKLKKDGEIYIIENSKKFLGGCADGKIDK